VTYKSFKLTNGRVKIQIEELLPQASWQGWTYQKPGFGNPGAEGAHYYYKSQTKVFSYHHVPEEGRFGFTLDVEEAGHYQILLRAARDSNDVPKHRNDIWLQVDGDTSRVLPKGTPELTRDIGGEGFIKFKGAQTAWVNAHMFSSEGPNPESIVVLDKGLHTIIFAGRSSGMHIDSLQIVRKSTPVPKDDVPPPAPEIAAARASVDRQGDDFESRKAGASRDLELGEEGGAAQSVGLRFHGLELDPDAEIARAYLAFTAARASEGAAAFDIEIEATTAARSYRRQDGPDDRSYLDRKVEWQADSWVEGETYRSADISELIEAVIAEGGLDALDALGFRISGTGQRAAHAFESRKDAPELVIDYV
jgi:hypothetical protein